MSAFERIVEALRSTDPPIRFQALSRLESSSPTSVQKEELQKHLAKETDPTVRFYLQLILVPEEDSTPDRGIAESDLIEELQKCLEGDPPDFLHFFLRVKWVPAKVMPLVVDLFRRLNWHEFPDDVLPFFLKLVRDYGSPADVPLLEELCRHRNPHVISLAVDALAEHGPNRIEPMLLPLLLNPSPGIRFQGIRNLLKRDPEEAFRHYQAMLFSPNRTEKLAALFHAYFFPFAKIEEAVLKFISFEQDPELLTRAGHLFIINPSRETPTRLMDLLENSAGPKKTELKRIILEVIRFLERSGEISQTAQEFLADLKNAYLRKRVGQLIARCRLLLDSKRIPDRMKVVEKLLELRGCGFPDATRLLEEYSRTETDPSIRARLEEWDHTPLAREMPLPPDLAEQASLRDCLEKIRTIRTDEYPRYKNWIRSLFERIPDCHKAILLRLIVPLEGDEAIPLLQTCLESAEPRVLAAAVELAGEFPESGIFEKTLAFTGHPDAGVRSAAFKTLTLHNKADAINVCRQWLLSSQTDRRHEGINMVASLDFPAVRGVLLECLAIERDPFNLATLFSVFTPHLSEPLIREIFGSLHGCPKPLRKTVEEQLRAAIDESPLGPMAEKEKELLLERSGEPSRQQNEDQEQRPDWQLEKVQRQRLSQASLPDPSGEEPLTPAPFLAKETIDETKEEKETGPETEKRTDPLADFLELLRAHADRWEDQEIGNAEARLHSGADRITALRLRVLVFRARRRAELARLRNVLVEELVRLLSASEKDYEAIAFSLDLLTPREGPLVMPFLRNLSIDSLPWEFLPFLTLCLKQFGDPQDSLVLATLCKHPDPRITYLAAEALEKVNPEDLKAFLVPLLSHDHPLIRSRAIRFLYRWDPPEAKMHFAGAMFSDDPGERKAALVHAIFLPFAAIELILLRFLVFESDPFLLRLAGNIIRANASQGMLNHLLEMAEQSAGTRYEFLRVLIEDVVQSLFRSGAETGDPLQYLDQRRQEVRQRRCCALLEQLKPSLQEPDRQIRGQAVSQIISLGQNGVTEAMKVLAAHLQQEEDPDIRRSIEGFSGLISEPSPMSSADRLTWLAALKKEDLADSRKTVQVILENGTPAEKQLSLRRLAELGDNSAVGKVVRCLEDPDSEVVFAAIETLRVLDRSSQQNALLPLLEHRSLQVRAAAVVPLAGIRPRQALHCLEMILGHLKPEQRAFGILAASQINFALVRDLLWSTYQREAHAENRAKIVHIMRQNVDKELFVQIWELHETLKEPDAQKKSMNKPVPLEDLAQFIQDAAQQLLATPGCGFETQDELHEYAMERLRKERETRQAVPAYAYSKVKKIIDKKNDPPTEPPLPEKALRWFRENPGMSLAAGILLGMFLVLAMRPAKPGKEVVRKSGSITVSLSRRKPKLDAFAAGQIREVKGIVQGLLINGLEIQVLVPATKILAVWAGSHSPFKPGKIFRGQIHLKSYEKDFWNGEILRAY